MGPYSDKRALLRTMQENSFRPFLILDMDFITTRGGQLGHGLIIRRYLRGMVRVGYSTGNKRPIRIPINKGEQHLTPLMQREMHTMICTTVGLHHPYPGGGLTAAPP